jgi:DNA-binding IclR family transcriptional regulator
MSEAPKYPVRTLDKAIEILNLLYSSDDHRGCGITELSVKSGLNKSVVHRIMDTLLYNGLVEKDPDTSRYRLGWGLYTLAQKVPQQNHLYNISINYLIELSKAVNTTVNLGILRGTNSIIISKIESNSKDAVMRIATQIGEPEEAYATSLGKIILADKDDYEIRDLFGSGFKFRKMTPNTVSNVDELMDRIHAARENGYAMDNEELALGLICIAKPIRDYTGSVVAAVSVSSLGIMMTEERKQLILNHLSVCCSSISKALGYSGNPVYG